MGILRTLIGFPGPLAAGIHCRSTHVSNDIVEYINETLPTVSIGDLWHRIDQSRLSFVWQVEPALCHSGQLVLVCETKLAPSAPQSRGNPLHQRFLLLADARSWSAGDRPASRWSWLSGEFHCANLAAN